MSSPVHDGTEEVLKVYYPPGGFIDHKAILTAIDLIEGTKTNVYLTDSAMARLTDEGKKKAAHFRRLMTFQLVINLIDESLVIVGPSDEIDDIRANYVDLMKASEKALSHLKGKGASSDAGKSSGSSKRPKSVDVPKFDVNKPGMQTFLNSMSLITQSYKFDSDKDIAQYYLNNLTENSKTLIFSIYPLNDKSFYDSSKKVIEFLESFIAPNIRIDALRDIRVLKMTENGGLKTYFKIFNQLVADMGPNQMSQETLVLYFIQGLNPNAVRNTNLNLHMHNYFTSNPTATITNLYAEAHKVISLAGNNNGATGLGKRAGPSDGGQQRPQQRPRNDYTGLSQRPQPPRRPQPQQRQQFLRPQQRNPDLWCTNCNNVGHTKEACTSRWTRDGKWIGKGQPPPGDYWTKQHAKDKAKVAMVNIPQPRQQPQPRQLQQPRQLTTQHRQPQPHQLPSKQHKRKVAFKALHLPEASDYPVVETITLADQAAAATVMEGLGQDVWESDHSDSESGKTLPPLLDDQRVVSLTRAQVSAWDLDSEEKNPNSVSSWNLAQSILNSKRPVKERLGEPNTYASKLKGPVPGPSAKPLGQLKFLKKSNYRVRR